MSRLSRRTLLRTGTATALAGLTGCLSNGREDAGSQTSEPSGGRSTNGSETSTESGSTPSTVTDDSTAAERSSTPISSAPVSPSLHTAAETTGFDIDLRGTPMVGSSSATLDLYYWSDYLCPFCRKFERRTFPKLVRTHIAEENVRVALLSFPNIADNSMTAAAMSRCVWRQVREESPDTFWNWHSTVFEEQGYTRGDWSSRSNLLELAETVDGVDASAADSCLSANREEIVSNVTAEKQYGERAGVDGTPAFVLYDPETDETVGLQGAQPYDIFDSQITSLLE